MLSGEDRGSSSGGRATGSGPGPRHPRKMYGSIAFGSDLSFDHVLGSENGYRSLEGGAEAPPASAATRGEWGVKEMFWRFIAGAVVLALFAATISSLKDGPEALARGAGATSATMAAKVSTAEDRSSGVHKLIG